MVWAEHLDGWVAWSEFKESEYITSGGESTGEVAGSTTCSTLYYEGVLWTAMNALLDVLTHDTPGCDEEVGLAEIAELVEAGTIEDDTMVYSDQVSVPVSTPRSASRRGARPLLRSSLNTGAVRAAGWVPVRGLG